MPNEISPVKSSERHIILDFLRGVALFGVCLANYPEFSLYTFQESEVVASMPTANIDHIWKYFHYIFIDGKFYTIFSLLFGVGFSIIISNILRKNQNGFSFFYRRMLILAFIGLAHLLLLWAGDILLLYALIGLVLPLFWNVSNRRLLIMSGILLAFPIAMEAFTVLTDKRFSLEIPVLKAMQYFRDMTGVSDDNFGLWLLEGKTYSDVLKFNLCGSFIRCQEFIEGNRVFKVLGLFLLGLYIGRNNIYANLEANKTAIKKVRFYGFIIGLPASCIFAWNAVSGHSLGLIMSAVLYAVSVIPMSFAYISSICLWYMKNKNSSVFKSMAAPGRMALTSYVGQSVLGMIIFYGIGFGLGASMGLVYVELIAIGVFIFQVIFSHIWLRYFQFGLLEWIWRMLTYGKWLRLGKK